MVRARRKSFSLRTLPSNSLVERLNRVCCSSNTSRAAEIFALGVGHLAAFDHRDNLARLDGIAEPLAQLGDCAEQPHRDARDVVAARHDRAGNGNAFAQDAAADLGHGELAGFHLPLR